MAKVVVNQAEVRFARAFLHALHANESNGYLLLAVIAWLRAESGSISRVIGNNPFNIRNSPFASGYRQTRNGNGHFALFSSLAVAAKATVYFLIHNHGNGYEKIVAAAQRAAATSNDQATQARDFLNYIALSKWDAGHYGLIIGVNPITHQPVEPDLRRNKLIFIWAALTGHPIPPSWFKDIVKPGHVIPGKTIVKTRAPTAHLNHFPRVEYINPYHARTFYEDRKHIGDQTLKVE